MKIDRMTVVAADRYISINGEGYQCEFTVPDRVHAVQFFGEHGHGQIEYERGPAIGFTGIEKLQPYIAPWHAGRVAALKAHVGYLETQVGHVLANSAALANGIKDQEAQLIALRAEGSSENANIAAVIANHIDQHKRDLDAADQSLITLRNDIAATKDRLAKAELAQAEKATV